MMLISIETNYQSYAASLRVSRFRQCGKSKSCRFSDLGAAEHEPRTAVVLIWLGLEEYSLGVHPPQVAALQAWLRRQGLENRVSVDWVFGGCRDTQIMCLGDGFNHLYVEALMMLRREQK
jgi:hypothetical protein